VAASAQPNLRVVKKNTADADNFKLGAFNTLVFDPTVEKQDLQARLLVENPNGVPVQRTPFTIPTPFATVDPGLILEGAGEIQGWWVDQRACRDALVAMHCSTEVPPNETQSPVDEIIQGAIHQANVFLSEFSPGIVYVTGTDSDGDGHEEPPTPETIRIDK